MIKVTPQSSATLARKLQPSKFWDGSPIDALILEGGGTKGTAYSGLVRGLEEKGLLGGIKKFAGTSAGSQTAALLAFGYTADEIKAAAANTDWNRLMDADCCCFSDCGCGDVWTTCSCMAACPSATSRLVCNLAYFKGRFIETSIDKLICEKLERLEAAGEITKPAARKNWKQCTFKELYDLRGIELKLGVIEVELQKFMFLSRHSAPDMAVSKAARASSSIPFVFQPVRHRGVIKDEGVHRQNCLFCDGALVGNLPVEAFVDRENPPKVLACDLVSTSNYGKLMGNRKKVAGISSYVASIMNTLAAAAQSSAGYAPGHTRAGQNVDIVHIDVGNAGVLDTTMSRRELYGMDEHGREAIDWYLTGAAPASSALFQGDEPVTSQPVTSR